MLLFGPNLSYDVAAAPASTRRKEHGNRIECILGITMKYYICLLKF
jgi:hypothetical protein